MCVSWEFSQHSYTSSPGGEVWILCVWSLHVLPASAQAFSGFAGFLPRSKDGPPGCRNAELSHRRNRPIHRACAGSEAGRAVQIGVDMLDVKESATIASSLRLE